MEINLSVSLKGYEKKPKGVEFAKIRYQERVFDTDSILKDLSYLIKNGHSFAHIYDIREKSFSPLNNLTKDKFLYTHIIPFDLDGVDISFEALKTKLTFLPNIIYTTFSHSKDKGKNRYRLLYIFNKRINGEQEYKMVYDCLNNQIISDMKSIDENFDVKSLDIAMQKISQIYLGSNPECELYSSPLFYSKTDFITKSKQEYADSPMMPSKKLKTKKTTSSTNTETKAEKAIVVKTKTNSKWNCSFVKENIYYLDFIIAFERLSHNNGAGKFGLIEKYAHRYPLFEHDQVEFINGYALLDKDFKSIHRGWSKDSLTGKSKTNKIKVSGRKSHLYEIGLRFLKMKHRMEIKFDYLLYLLLSECYKHCENPSTVHLNDIFSAAYGAFESNLEGKNKIFFYKNKKAFIVDKAFCNQYKMKTKAYAAMVKGFLKRQEIRIYYDASLSIAHNLIILNENGVTCGSSTLYKYKDVLSNMDENILDSIVVYNSCFTNKPNTDRDLLSCG